MKAQGLPLNTIVLGALAVLVLVLLAAAFVPGVGSFFQSLFGLTPTDDVSMCNAYCNQFNWQYATSAALTTALANHPFCTDFTTTCDDLITCAVTLSDGSSFTIPSGTCP